MPLGPHLYEQAGRRCVMCSDDQAEYACTTTALIRVQLAASQGCCTVLGPHQVLVVSFIHQCQAFCAPNHPMSATLAECHCEPRTSQLTTDANERQQHKHVRAVRITAPCCPGQYRMLPWSVVCRGLWRTSRGKVVPGEGVPGTVR
jgi:hypothetical protein